MTDPTRSICILMADDDPEDRLLAKDAFEEVRLANCLTFVEDGEQLLAYLRREGKWANPAESPRPGLILLDLNMPRKNGMEALAELKADADLRQIPVVVLTTSKAEEDVYRSYDLGVSSFITKPVSFDGLVQAVSALKRYYLEIVELPNNTTGGATSGSTSGSGESR